MNKITGQELKKQYFETTTLVMNIENKINKKFNLILDNYRDYLSDTHKRLLIVKSIEDFTYDRKLAIIIQTEANYIEATGNQMKIFN